MIIKKEDMPVQVRPNVRGGEGSVIDMTVVPKDKMMHARLFNLMTIKKGCSIGEHQHLGEVEYYYILQGEGIVKEADGDKICRKGDVVITGWGDTHAIRNEKDEDLVFIASIALEA